MSPSRLVFLDWCFGLIASFFFFFFFFFLFCDTCLRQLSKLFIFIIYIRFSKSWLPLSCPSKMVIMVIIIIIIISIFSDVFG